MRQLIPLVSGPKLAVYWRILIPYVETRLQRSTAIPGESAASRIIAISKDMFKHEGFRAFYQGITPRIMRVAPGQVNLDRYPFLS